MASISRKGTPNSRKPASASPKPPTVAAATPASSRPGSRPVSPTKAAAPVAVPVHDLGLLLNLPLRLTLVANGSIPERTVDGSLWTYDAALSLVVLSTPSATNPAKRNYSFVKTPQIKTVVVLSPAPDAALSSLADALRQVSPKDAQARVERAVAEDHKRRSKVGKGVTEEAQALFDALGKTLPVRWHETTIVVLDEVVIGPPYGVANVQVRAAQVLEG